MSVCDKFRLAKYTTQQFSIHISQVLGQCLFFGPRSTLSTMLHVSTCISTFSAFGLVVKVTITVSMTYLRAKTFSMRGSSSHEI